MARKRKDWVSEFKAEAMANIKMAFVEQLEEVMQGAEILCQSPIEVAMLYAMREDLVSYDGFYDLPVEFWCVQHKRWPESVAPFKGVWVFPQCQMGRYRVDFGIYVRDYHGDQWFAVECDGHDFHEKTKEQARSDKSRDRWLLKNRVRVLRFTGQEIYEDPKRCAGDVHDALYAFVSEGLK